MNIELSKEAKELVEAARAKREAKKAERDAAANEAIEKLVIENGGDLSNYHVHKMPEQFGGAVIHALPGPEFWGMIQREGVRALRNSKGETEMYRKVAEGKDLLVHPPLADLQAWVSECKYSGLYGEIFAGISERVAGQGGKD